MENMIVASIFIASIAMISNIYKDIVMQRLIKQNEAERKDLLNRIMAKNLAEYKNVNNDTLPKGSSPIKKSSVDFEGMYRE